MTARATNGMTVLTQLSRPALSDLLTDLLDPWMWVCAAWCPASG